MAAPESRLEMLPKPPGATRWMLATGRGDCADEFVALSVSIRPAIGYSFRVYRRNVGSKFAEIDARSGLTPMGSQDGQ